MDGSDRIKRLQARAKKKRPLRADAKPRVVAYLRVSTEGQFADGYGIEVQDRAVRAFAVSQGYELVDVIVDRVSGATPPSERPGFGKVLELAEAEAFSILLLYRFDRLARNVLFAVTSVHELRDRFGVVVRSVTEPIDTATPMGEMIFTVLASMAAQERQLITERTYGGRREKASNGGYAGGAIPYGYQRDKEGGLVIVPDQAEIVRRIFRERISGRTLQAIADGLNTDGVPSSLGGKWYAGRIGYLIDNPKYRGAVEYLFKWNGADTHVLREGQHDAILTPVFLAEIALLRPAHVDGSAEAPPTKRALRKQRLLNVERRAQRHGLDAVSIGV